MLPFWPVTMKDDDWLPEVKAVSLKVVVAS
jgi:hypothetical protein